MLPLGLVRSSSPLTAVYIPKDFFLHAASLPQTFVHWGIFVAAATRRCPDRVSVPMWRDALSRPLPVVALVGRYPTNKLIGHEPLPDHRSICPQNHAIPRGHQVLPALSQRDRSPAAIPVSGVRYPCIPHPCATDFPSGYPSRSPFDLHALTTPPAFVLSQDQTLQF